MTNDSVIQAQVIDAFRHWDNRLAWDLVCHHIGRKIGMTIPNETLTADCVPVDGSWEHPSAARAFALTYYEFYTRCSCFNKKSNNLRK